MKENSDQQLVADYLKGNEKALEVLIGRYLKPIYSFVFRYIGDGQEAEDITQEIFIKIWRNLKKFDQKRSFKTWIFSIAKNVCLDNLKKKKAIPFSEFEKGRGGNVLIEKFADPAPLADKIFERKNTAKILEEALQKLAPEYRMILFLRYNDHFTFREISEIFGEPLNTIKSRHQRAILALRKILNLQEK